jgi:hypothetical protein
MTCLGVFERSGAWESLYLSVFICKRGMNIALTS